MGITNQMVSDKLDKTIEAMERVVTKQSDADAKRAEQNEADHSAFRIAMQEFSVSVVVLQKIVERHERNWGLVWKIAIVPVLGGFVGGLWILITS